MYLILKVFSIAVATHFCSAQYYGAHISRLSELHHGVSGDVFAVDSRTIFIKGFTYDGEGPAAYFYVGNSRAPTNQGAFRIRDEKGSSGVLKKYRNKDITLTLPEGKTLRDIKWFSIWCDEFSVDFGNVVINKNLDFPRPQKIGSLKGIHAVSSDNIVVVDAQTLLIPNFSYDGVAPDAKFWVGRGVKPTSSGLRISDENGKETPLKRYDKKTIVLTLPGDLTVFDIGHFGVWCEAFTVDFGHVRVPEKINVPPSLKMLGISPQSKLNCEVLHDELAFEVRWAVAGESVVIQLVAKLADDEYMSFGVSSDHEKSLMVDGDVVVAWVNRLTGKGYAQDYFLEAKSQCSGTRGSCPDTRLKDNSNSIRLLNAAIVNDYSIVTYQRPLKPADAYDKQIFTNKSQAVIWAIGPLNQRFEVSYHTTFLKKDMKVDFGRQPFWNCPVPENDAKPSFSENVPRPQTQKQTQNINRADAARPTPTKPTARPVPTPKAVVKRDAWEIPPIQCNEPEDGVFYAQMGPTGGKRGYPAITGHVGWGISWYVNGLLIPEINVVRNKTYTFVIEGGNDPETAAKYHPFYITDDSIGGYEHKTQAEKDGVSIYAGVHRSRNGKVTPIGVGRICNWTPDINGPSADEYSSFGAYQRSLTLKCEEGEPGILVWKPDQKTPDTLYYQCFTHRYLGWKINVLDSCDGQPQASNIQEVFADADADAEASINHETKLAPNENFLQQHEKDLIKHHNMNGGLPKITTEFQNTGEFNKLISDGIKVAEALEESLRHNNGTRQKQEQQNSNITYVHEDKELLAAIAKIPQANPANRRPQYQQKRPQNSFPVPVFLRPPQGVNYPPQGLNYPPPGVNFPYQMKLPQRRPIAIERRPYNKKPQPLLLPQQSAMINTFKKPPFFGYTQNMRNYVKPRQPTYQSDVLYLGEQTEIKPFYKKSENGMGKPMKTHQIRPQVSNNKHVPESPLPHKHTKKIERVPPRSPFKDPFDIKAEKKTFEKASNTGFKADTIIVESGFRPIFSTKDDEESEESEPAYISAKISRRSDNFEESYEKSDPQSFEPMFIPSPRDSVALPLVNQSKEVMVAEASDLLESFYYLPPTDSKRSAVTYDAKAILDTSLLNDPLPAENDFVELSTKTKQFIKNNPKTVPFTGEIPSDLKLQLSTKLSVSKKNNRQ